MSARDELAGVIGWAIGNTFGIHDTSPAEDAEIADAILAAGYTKPRTITTAEELDGLAGGSIIRDSKGCAWQKYSKVYDKHTWFPATRDHGFYYSSNLVDDARTPATVLYEPTA